MQLKTPTGSLFYEKWGTGHPIILLHGNGETHHIFNRTAEILNSHFTVYAIDTRGHGESSSVSEFHYNEMADDIYQFITILHLEKPILYGFSDGGIIGLLLAIQYPNLLSKLVISGANTNPNGIKPSWFFLFKMIYVLTRSAKFKLMIEEPTITNEMLNSISTPTYITVGSKDIISQEHTKNMHINIHNSTLKVFENETHGSYAMKNDKLAQYLLDICSKE